MCNSIKGRGENLEENNWVYLVPNGFQQKGEVGSSKTPVTVAKLSSIYVLWEHALTRDLYLTECDVNNVTLNLSLDEESFN